MEQIKTFEDACKAVGVDPKKVLPDVSAFPVQHQKAVTAAARLFIVAEALNGDWKPDWNNDDEWKYYPWFYMEKDEDINPAGFRLRSVDSDSSGSYVGSHLCFRDRETAQYAGTQFIELYRDLMVL